MEFYTGLIIPAGKGMSRKTLGKCLSIWSLANPLILLSPYLIGAQQDIMATRSLIRGGENGMFEIIIASNVDACRTEAEIADELGNRVAIVYEDSNGWHA